MDKDDQRSVAANLQAIEDELAALLTAHGRDRGDVTLVAVTKYVDFELTRQVFQSGCRDLGESRPQSLVEKADLAAASDSPPSVHWHMIGHLQRNKARRVVERADWIHSIDSLRLLDAVARMAHEQGVHPKCLLEVNISGDPSKHGFKVSEMPEVMEQLVKIDHLPPIMGLMAMASIDGGVDQARRDFAATRALKEKLSSSCPETISLEHLSIGMSADWREAIAEGATMIRIGSALFEGVR